MSYEKICLTCGNAFKTYRKDQKYCSSGCRYGVNEPYDVDLDFDWKQEADHKYTCRYNPQGCSCSDRRCRDCGWNPEVAKERLAQYKNQHRGVQA